MTLKAIETSYKGYRFRSRLEARWAVFFDYLNLQWEYEPEGFHLNNGAYYLPDFRIISPQDDIFWYEVKPSEIKKDDKLEQFKLQLQEDKLGYGFLLSGDPGSYITRCDAHYGRDTLIYYDGPMVCPGCAAIQNPAYGFYVYGDTSSFGCRFCDLNPPCGSGRPEETGFSADWMVIPHKGNLVMDENSTENYLWKIRKAIDLSRSARFEHGASVGIW